MAPLYTNWRTAIAHPIQSPSNGTPICYTTGIVFRFSTPAPGALVLCPVCWWEDDGQEDSDASEVRLTVNGQLSLDEARRFYTQCGAAHPRFLPYVRKPQSAEL